MKFKNKDGNVFYDLEKARKSICLISSCPMCDLALEQNDYGVSCHVLVERFPQEAARLMGLEVIDSEQKNDVNKKTLKDYTLSEMKEFCEQQQPYSEEKCNACIFGNVCCIPPDEWKLNELKFTTEEIERAKAILMLFPQANTLREYYGVIDVLRDDEVLCGVEGRLFPSIENWDIVNISEIVNDK